MIEFAGYAARFDIIDRGGDIIRPGAFAGHPHCEAVPLLHSHRRSVPAGKLLRIFQDERGLFVRGRIENEMVEHRFRTGGLRGLSIGYCVRNFRRGADRRELLELVLVEVSLVEHPMQPACLAEAA